MTPEQFQALSRLVAGAISLTRGPGHQDGEGRALTSAADRACERGRVLASDVEVLAESARATLEHLVAQAEDLLEAAQLALGARAHRPAQRGLAAVREAGKHLGRTMISHSPPAVHHLIYEAIRAERRGQVHAAEHTDRLIEITHTVGQRALSDALSLFATAHRIDTLMPRCGAGDAEQ